MSGAVVGRGARHEFLQGVPRLAPSGKDIRDGFHGRRSQLSEFYITSRLSLNSLPLGFEKFSCFVQLPDKLFDLRDRWSANLLNKWRDIRVDLGRRSRLWVNSIAVVASGFHNRLLPLRGAPITPHYAHPLTYYPKAQIRQGADRVSAPTRPVVRRKAGQGLAQRAGERVMPERVYPQKRPTPPPIWTCWPANVNGWGLD